MKPETKLVVAALHADGVQLSSEFAPRLERFMERAHLAMPRITASPKTWALRLQRLFELMPGVGWVEALDRIDAGEHLLVAGLADGDPAAVTAFETIYMPEVDRVLRRYSLDADARTEYRQRARIRMLVGDPPKPARIQEFRGRGQLSAWVRTVTARMVLNAQRDSRKHETDEGLEALISPAVQFRRRDAAWRSKFQDLLRQSFRKLTRQERTILRMRYLDNLPAAALARAFKVHESTMSRWLARARDNLRATLEGNAIAELGDKDRAEELLALLDSHIDLSLQGLFESGVTDVEG